jgi:3',5'-cyclic AMP phosphodiesterase CpdA
MLPDERAPLARIARPTDADASFLVVSDAHVTGDAEGTWKVFHRTEERLRAAVAASADVDALVLAGDLTKDGAPGEFETVEGILGDAPVPVVAVPGNHDVPKTFDDHDTPPVTAFAESFAPDGLPFVRRVGGVDLVGLDSATLPDGSLAASHDGAVSSEQLSWVRETVSPDVPTVAVFHHPAMDVREHVPRFSTSDHLVLRNASAVRAALADAGVDLAVSGHVHWPAASRLDGVTHLTAPAACSFPQAALRVDVGPTGTDVRLVSLADAGAAEEARRLANHDDGRDGALVENAKAGYFERFPMVEG